jgi:UDP-N-acetylglucosamine--N-acetylmuramyl-(pentapeptide) pyrophosphoryl-undecaprenol N-acetylglucosamine transferase
LALRVIIAAGGTGGHIFPGLAIAQQFQRRLPETEILFVGTPRGLESKIISREGFKLELIRIGALKGVSIFERVRTLIELPFSLLAARRIIKRFKPDVVIGVGGYASGPMLLAAAFAGIATMVVEPNAVPGFTNRQLARFVDRAAVAFEQSLKYFRGKAVVTGNPVRSRFAELKSKPRTDYLCILVFGGSQGAHSINSAMVGALAYLSKYKHRLRIIHQTGECDFEQVKRAYLEAGFKQADVRAFIHDMAEQFEQADVLVCRSGATTVAEVAAAGKAAIFIPFPFATDDHQRKNAEAFVQAGAARLILQSELTPERLAKELIALIECPDEITRMEQASRKLGSAESASRCVELAIEIARKRHANA